METISAVSNPTITETLTHVINQYLLLLYRLFEYDVTAFSQIWICYWLLIPAIFYLQFFIVKWIVLTLPIWMPIWIVFSVLKLKITNIHNNYSEMKVND